METHKRTLVKTVGYRVGAIVITFLVCEAVTGAWLTSLEITAGVAVTKTLFYWLYERCWTKTRWGLLDGLIKED